MKSRLEEYEELFKNRYTMEEEVYAKMVSEGIPPVICVYPYENRFTYGNRGRGDYRRGGGNYRGGGFRGRGRGGFRENEEYGVRREELDDKILEMSSSKKSDIKELSKDETEIYDRQIRLWGLEAQNRLRNSAVLLVGLSGLGAEVAKNLMLAGVKSLTLMDDKDVTENELANQFLVEKEAIGQNRAMGSEKRSKDLNPNVELKVVAASVESSTEEFFKDYDLVILIDQTYDVVNKINKICRKGGIRFQAGGVLGWNGYAFFDFNNHIFLLPKPKVIIPDTLDDDTDEPSPKKQRADQPSVEAVTLEDEEDQKIKKAVPFSSFEAAFNVEWRTKKYLRKAKHSVPSSYFPIRTLLRLKNANGDKISDEEFLEAWKKEIQYANQDEAAQTIQPMGLTFFDEPQLSPVCAILGGIIGQEGIKALSQNDIPLQNTFWYSALDTTGIVCKFPPD